MMGERGSQGVFGQHHDLGMVLVELEEWEE